MTDLPIDAVLPELLDALDTHNRCLLVAQPGAGKTTRAPLALIARTPPEAGKWLLLEPRRVAARLAAGFMAEQLGEQPGQTVGYRVRGESRAGPDTRLEVVTQGILTRMLQHDPGLDGVAGIIFDEFHERSLEADLGLALALDVQQGLREGLKLLVMSATLDVDALLAVLGPDTPVIDCPGRAWPVTTLYRPPQTREEPEDHRARVVREALADHEGDVLVFLPGQREIRRLHQRLASLSGPVELVELHGQLPLARQQAALHPSVDGQRRLILATAIAESSLTVPGVRIVVDCGQERVPVFQPRSGLTRLDTRRVNRASADQRRGRAGRVAAGFCYRLWAEEAILVPHGEPEITQADLAGLAFELARWGVADAGLLPWVTVPPAPALASGRALLVALGLLTPAGNLTDTGRACARWPTHPRLATLLQAGVQTGQLSLACWLVAWLEENPDSSDIDIAALLANRPRRDGPGGGGRWYRAARQWAARARCELEPVDPVGAGTLLARAYPDRIAQGQAPGRFKLATGGQALVPEHHPRARSPWLVAVELDGLASGARVFHGAAVTAAELEQLFPDTRHWRADLRWNDDAGRLVGEEVRGLGPLVMERRPLPNLDPEAVRAALLQALRQRGLPWRDDDRQLLGRLRLVRDALGDPWPDVAEPALLDNLEHWLGPHLDGVTRLDQLERMPLGRHLMHSLDWNLQRQLDSLAPTHLDVPSGSRIRLDYSGEEPVLAVKLQELFGQTQTPRLVEGRVPVLIHLLSPARRPVQVTRDLASFWATTYFDVRKDLKGRYPKHPWPEDPLTAVATARAKPRAPGLPR